MPCNTHASLCKSSCSILLILGINLGSSVFLAFYCKQFSTTMLLNTLVSGNFSTVVSNADMRIFEQLYVRTGSMAWSSTGSPDIWQYFGPLYRDSVSIKLESSWLIWHRPLTNKKAEIIRFRCPSRPMPNAKSGPDSKLIESSLSLKAYMRRQTPIAQ